MNGNAVSKKVQTIGYTQVQGSHIWQKANKEAHSLLKKFVGQQKNKNQDELPEWWEEKKKWRQK